MGRADHQGVFVSSAGGNGVYIGSAGNHGFQVLNAEENGLDIGQTNEDGVNVFKAGNPAFSTSSSFNNGFSVEGAEGHGLFVGKAYQDGIWINSSEKDGVHVHSAEEDGIHVQSAGNPSSTYTSGLSNGIEVAGAEANGVFIGNTGSDGVYVHLAGGNGLHVSHSDDDAIYIENSDDEGIRIQSCQTIGVYAYTENTSNNWGFYTPNNIYCLNDMSRTRSVPVHNNNTEALEPGDLVSISGGWKDNVLDKGNVPIINVEKANMKNSSSIIGVVQNKLSINEELHEIQDGLAITKTFNYAEGSAGFGEYLSVVVFGPADVKIASREDIKVGEAIAAADGVARKVRTTEVNGITIAENTGIVGKALENANGSGKLKVFVNCR